MPEPTTITFATISAALSTATLAFFGVDYYSLLYGFIGALLAIPHAEQMGKLRAALFVALSTVAGAAIGNGIVAYLGLQNKPLLFVGCLIGGILAQALAGLLINSAPRLVDAAIRRVQGGKKP